MTTPFCLPPSPLTPHHRSKSPFTAIRFFFRTTQNAMISIRTNVFAWNFARFNRIKRNTKKPRKMELLMMMCFCWQMVSTSTVAPWSGSNSAWYTMSSNYLNIYRKKTAPAIGNGHRDLGKSTHSLTVQIELNWNLAHCTATKTPNEFKIIWWFAVVVVMLFLLSLLSCVAEECEEDASDFFVLCFWRRVWC